MNIYVKLKLQGRYSEVLWQIYSFFQENLIPKDSLKQKLGTWKLELSSPDTCCWDIFYTPKVVLWRSMLRASEMSSLVGSTLQVIKGKTNVSYKCCYSEKSFAKCLWHVPSPWRKAWVGAALLVLLLYLRTYFGDLPSIKIDLFCKCQWFQNISQGDSHYIQIRGSAKILDTWGHYSSSLQY